MLSDYIHILMELSVPQTKVLWSLFKYMINRPFNGW